MGWIKKSITFVPHPVLYEEERVSDLYDYQNGNRYLRFSATYRRKEIREKADNYRLETI